MASCATVEFHDAQSNSHKFYRAYVIGKWVAFQYGRVGAIGVFSAKMCISGIEAQNAAGRKLDIERKKGYVDTDRVYFDYDIAKVSSAKHDLWPLDVERQRHSSNAPSNKGAPAPDPKPKQAPAPVPAASTGVDVFTEFNTRVLAAIVLAAGDKGAAVVELALLTERLSELAALHVKAASYHRSLEQMVLGAPIVVSV